MCHITGQRTQVTLRPYFWWWTLSALHTDAFGSPSSLLWMCPRLGGALAFRLSPATLFGRLLPDYGYITLQGYIPQGSPEPVTGWFRSMKAQLPWLKLESVWKYNLHSRIPLWGQTSATLWGTLPKITLVSPGCTSLINHCAWTLVSGFCFGGSGTNTCPICKELWSSFNSPVSDNSNSC